MSPKQLTITSSRLSLPTDTTTDIQEIPIDRVANLVAVNIIPRDVFADMFIGIEITYNTQKVTQTIFKGYLKRNSQIFWSGRIPTDTETELTIEFLNISGAAVDVILSAVIDNE